MKKIMALVGAIVLAVAANAATVSWTAGNVYLNGSTTDKCGGIAYYMVTSVLSVSDAQALAGKGAAAFEAAVGSSYSWTPATAGTYSVSSANAVENATLGLDDSKAYTAYLMIFDGATIADSTYYFVSTTVDFSTYEGANNATSNFGNLKTASQNASNWATVAPEPTSGLLLLLGMAGLALKRKIA